MSISMYPKRATFILAFIVVLLSACQSSQQTSQRLAVGQRSLQSNCRFRDMQWQGAELIINAGRYQGHQHLYVLHNRSSHMVLQLGHHVPNPSASAGWDSQLDPAHWAAFTTGSHRFVVTCYHQTTSYKRHQINCRKVLYACQMPPTAFTKSMQGSYWLVENRKSYTELMDAIRLRR